MTEEKDQETIEAEDTATQEPETPQADSTEDPVAELEKARAALKAANAEAAARRKKLEAYEAAEEERKKAEMSEIDRLKLEAEQLEAENAKLKRSNLQKEIAEKIGLPAAFADRINGETLEDMEADAQALLEAMPVKQAANPKITNPGENGSRQTETDPQKRSRLLG